MYIGASIAASICQVKGPVCILGTFADGLRLVVSAGLTPKINPGQKLLPYLFPVGIVKLPDAFLLHNNRFYFIAPFFQLFYYVIAVQFF